MFLILLVFLGVEVAGWHVIFGIIVPYLAFAIFVIGLIYRIFNWARSPVPFKITTTCGQQKTLPWIKSSKLENPHNFWGVVGRMFLEIFFFRSLFRNTKADLKGGNLVYGESKWLWLGGLAFHYTFLFILLRHLRFFMEPVPQFIYWLQNLDGLMEVGVPVLYMTDVVFLGAVTYLFLRRVVIPQVRFISLDADYFPLFLLFSIGLTGVLMRYFLPFKVDIIGVKELTTGLIRLNPVMPESIGTMFFIHLFLVSTLLVYFPLSKLMHMGGVFLSPTRNMRANSREHRHINPWNYPVKVHTYEEWEDEFRDVMRESGLPLEKE